MIEAPFGCCELCDRPFKSQEEKLDNASFFCGWGYYSCPRCKAIVEDATKKIKTGVDIRESHLPD